MAMGFWGSWIDSKHGDVHSCLPAQTLRRKWVIDFPDNTNLGWIFYWNLYYDLVMKYSDLQIALLYNYALFMLQLFESEYIIIIAFINEYQKNYVYYRLSPSLSLLLWLPRSIIHKSVCMCKGKGFRLH